jgi:hypothetical protein
MISPSPTLPLLHPAVWSVCMPAKKGRVLSDVDPQQVLCLVKFPANRTSPNPFPNQSIEQVTSTAMRWPTRPLRLIVARFPHFEDCYSNGTQKLMWYLDTLDCGHQIVVYPYDVLAGKKRHQCRECAEISVAKKSARSERRRLARGKKAA